MEAEACHNNRELAEEAHTDSFVAACVGAVLCRDHMVQQAGEVPLGLADDVGVAEDAVEEEHKGQHPVEESRWVVYTKNNHIRDLLVDGVVAAAGVVEAEVVAVDFAVETGQLVEEQYSAIQSQQAEEVPDQAPPVEVQRLQLLVEAHTGGEDVVPGEVVRPEEEEERHTGVLVAAAVAEAAAVDDASAPIDHNTRIAQAWGEEAAAGSNRT